MRISPALLLLLLLILIFEPSLQDWATQNDTYWFRPYALWLLVIVFVAWTVEQSRKHQESIDRESGEKKETR